MKLGKKDWKQAIIEDLRDTSNPYPIGDGDHGQITPSDYTENGIPYIRVKDIVDNEIMVKKLVHISEKTHNENRKSHLHPDDLLITKTGSIGKVAIIPKEILKSNTTSSVGKISFDKNKIDPFYVYHYFRTSYFQKYVNSISERSIQKGFNILDLKKFIVPIPKSNSNQKEIVSVLNLVDDIKKNHKKAMKFVEQLTYSIINQISTGKLTEKFREKLEEESAKKLIEQINLERLQNYEISKSKKRNKVKKLSKPKLCEKPQPYSIKNWCLVPLETLVEKIVDCPHSTPKWAESGMICVRTNQFKPFKLDLNNSKYVDQKTFDYRTERLRPKSGDILYSREGAILGVACQIPEDVELCMGQRMMLIRCNEKWLKKDYLTAILNSEFIKHQISTKIAGTASPHLNVQDVKSFLIPVPPLKEQERIVNILENTINLKNKLKNVNINDIYTSIQSKIFSSWYDSN